jgi:putative transposase
MCSALNVSTSGYYRWKNRKPSRSSLRRHVLAVKIREIHVQFKKIYGYRRVYKSLHKEGLRVGQNAVLRIMRQEGIKPWYVRKHRKYREIQPECLAAPNRIKQQFKVGKPNKAWLTDITEINTPDGKLYVAIVEDLGSRKVVGHAMGTRMTSMLPLSALRKALMERDIPKALICHSDQGSQYRSKQYRKELTKHGIRPSMSRRGNCYDNAPAESFFAIMKRELDLRSMHTREQTSQEIFEFIECFYNRKRIHSALGYMSPEEHELHWKTKYSSRIIKKHMPNFS